MPSARRLAWAVATVWAALMAVYPAQTEEVCNLNDDTSMLQYSTILTADRGAISTKRLEAPAPAPTLQADPSYAASSVKCTSTQAKISPGGNDGSTFRCKGGYCLPMKGVCNGKKNCGDGSDEGGCKADPSYTAHSVKCSSAQANIARGSNYGSTFRCKGGYCLPMKGRCNGKKNCGDGSDEEGCNSTEASTSTTTTTVAPAKAATTTTVTKATSTKAGTSTASTKAASSTSTPTSTSKVSTTAAPSAASKAAANSSASTTAPAANSSTTAPVDISAATADEGLNATPAPHPLSGQVGWLNLTAGPYGLRGLTWGKAMPRIFRDIDCSNLGNANGEVSNCKHLCERTRGCNAINYSPVLHDCVLRACPTPAPMPTWKLSGYVGYLAKAGSPDVWAEKESMEALKGMKVEGNYKPDGISPTQSPAKLPSPRSPSTTPAGPTYADVA